MSEEKESGHPRPWFEKTIPEEELAQADQQAREYVSEKGVLPFQKEISEEEMKVFSEGRSQFSPHQKLAAAIAYVATGNQVEASKASGVPIHTVRKWVKERKWWQKAVALARTRINFEVDQKYNQILNETAQQLLDRVVEGDYKLVKGQKRRVPLPAKDLLAIHTTVLDKLKTLHGPEEQEQQAPVNINIGDLAQRLANTSGPKPINEE